MAGMPVFQDSPSQLKNQIYVTDGSNVVALKSNATGALNISTTGADTVTVAATDLDIRDLTNASDNVLVYGQDSGTNYPLKTDATGALYTNAAHALVDTTEETISVTSTSTGAPSTQREIAVLSSYGFLVDNTANATVGVNIQLQLSPDGTTWVDDGSQIALAAAEAMVVTPSRFLRYARALLFLETGTTAMDVGVWFQGQS